MNFVKIEVGRNSIYEFGNKVVVFQKKEGDEQHYECTHEKVACKAYEIVRHVRQIEGVESVVYLGGNQCLQIGIRRNHTVFVKKGFRTLYGFGIIVGYLINIDIGERHRLRDDERNEEVEERYENSEKQYKG